MIACQPTEVSDWSKPGAAACIKELPITFHYQLSTTLPYVTEQRSELDSLDIRSSDIPTYKYIAALRSFSPDHMHEQYFRSTRPTPFCSAGGSAMYNSFLDESLLQRYKNLRA